jgi:hypothetical protein
LNSQGSKRSSRISLKGRRLQVLRNKANADERDRLGTYEPYPKQHEFHAAGAEHRERLLMAGNQVGKTFCGAAEAAMHLTGLYPEWWTGRRFDRAVRMWAGSKTAEVARDTVQRLLIGPPRDASQWGTGLIPRARLLDKALVFPDWAHPTAADRVIVYHKGAYVLHLLRTQLGDRRFWAGVRSYTRAQMGKSVTTADFQREMERASGADLSGFFREWVYSAVGGV